jgi:hypothetical protein
MEQKSILPFLNFSTRWELEGCELHAPAALHPANAPVPIVHEAGWAPAPVWTGARVLVQSV